MLRARPLPPGCGGVPSRVRGAGLGWGDGGHGAERVRGRSFALRAFLFLSRSLAPAFSLLLFSFFSFLERSPAPGVWNQLDKLLSYGGGRGGEGAGGRRWEGRGAPLRVGAGRWAPAGRGAGTSIGRPSPTLGKGC